MNYLFSLENITKKSIVLTMNIDKSGMTLKQFIENNQSLLSALAVFAAITTLSGNLNIQWLNILFSFIIIAGMIIIWLEVNTQFPEKVSSKLFLFHYILLWGLGALVFYWLLEFRTIWHIFLFIPLTIIFLYEILLTLNPLTKFKIVQRIFGIGKQKNWFQKIFKFIIMLVIVCISFFLAISSSTPLNLLLDAAKNTFK